MAEKKAEFVVTDRRRFGTEGDPRPEAQVAEEEKPAAPPAAQAPPPPAKATVPPQSAPPSQSAQTQVQPGSPESEHEEEIPPPPTAEEQRAQSEAYKASSKKIDDMIAAAGKAGQGPMELTFEDVIESFFLSALIHLGLYPPGAESRRVDIIGARQTIDSLEILQEKTKGNLTDNEKATLQDVLFRLRMAFIETTNAVAASATRPGAMPPGAMPPGGAPPLDRK